MKFLMMMIPRVYQPATPEAERAGEGFSPPKDAILRMMKYNQELSEAGALLALEGLHPIARGARVAFDGKSASVTDGPYIESKEVIGGYWVLQVASKEEAVAWAQRVPADPGDVIELRQIFEMTEFPEEIRQASEKIGVRARLEGNGH